MTFATLGKSTRQLLHWSPTNTTNYWHRYDNLLFRIHILIISTPVCEFMCESKFVFGSGFVIDMLYTLCSIALFNAMLKPLTHWGRATHICVGKLTTIGSDDGLSPGRRQAIIWTIAGISLIGPLGTNFSEILIRIQTFSFKKMHLKMPSAKWRPFVSASMC